MGPNFPAKILAEPPSSYLERADFFHAPDKEASGIKIICMVNFGMFQ
jgi:hypothetical protein